MTHVAVSLAYAFTCQSNKLLKRLNLFVILY